MKMQKSASIPGLDEFDSLLNDIVPRKMDSLNLALLGLGEHKINYKTAFQWPQLVAKSVTQASFGQSLLMSNFDTFNCLMIGSYCILLDIFGMKEAPKLESIQRQASDLGQSDSSATLPSNLKQFYDNYEKYYNCELADDTQDSDSNDTSSNDNNNNNNKDNGNDKNGNEKTSNKHNGKRKDDIKTIKQEIKSIWQVLETLLFFSKKLSGTKEKSIDVDVKGNDVSITTISNVVKSSTSKVNVLVSGDSNNNDDDDGKDESKGNEFSDDEDQTVFELKECITRLAMLLYCNLDNINKLTFVKDYLHEMGNDETNERENAIIEMKRTLDDYLKTPLLKIGAFMDIFYLIVNSKTSSSNASSSNANGGNSTGKSSSSNDSYQALRKFIVYFDEFEDDSNNEHFLLSNKEPAYNKTLFDIVDESKDKVHKKLSKLLQNYSKTVSIMEDTTMKYSNYMFETFQHIRRGLTYVC